jgi:FkbM family methyltransferase
MMVDVGAHHGGSSAPFLAAGWRVLAFEPDAANRDKLTARLSKHERFTIDPRAVSDAPAAGVSFFASTESTGASSLRAFTPGHAERGTVEVTRLDTALAEHGVDAVRLLKIDAEGYDLMVLRGAPWGQIRPDVVMVEFEDRKTEPLGYRVEAMADLLAGYGYTVLCSEWHPIRRYGVTHDWRRLFRWGHDRPGAQSWGNLVAFRYASDARTFEHLVLDAVRRGALTMPASPAKRTAAQTASAQSGHPSSDFGQQVLDLEKQAAAAAQRTPAPLRPGRLAAGALPWAPRQDDHPGLSGRVQMAIGKLGRVYFGRAGVLALGVVLCWMAGVAVVASAGPAWLAMALAGLGLVPLLMLIGLIAITARRQSADNSEAVREAAERAARAVAQHQRQQLASVAREQAQLIEQAARLIGSLERRRMSTRSDLEHKLDTKLEAIAVQLRESGGAASAADDNGGASHGPQNGSVEHHNTSDGVDQALTWAVSPARTSFAPPRSSV